MKIFLFKIAHWLLNMVITRLPFNFLRTFFLRHMFRMKIGKGSHIAYRVSMISPWKIKIGNNCIINSYVLLDGREGIEIQNNVDIGWFSKIYTLQHDVNSPIHKSIGKKIFIDSNCWIATSAIILPGCHLNEGSVIATGAVVTKDTNAFTVYGGVPAKQIKTRSKILNYALTEPGIRI